MSITRRQMLIASVGAALTPFIAPPETIEDAAKLIEPKLEIAKKPAYSEWPKVLVDKETGDNYLVTSGSYKYARGEMMEYSFECISAAELEGRTPRNLF